MSSVAAQPGCCVLVLVVYLKIKKNKLLQNCNIVHASVVKCVVVHLVCCVFLLVPEV